MQILLFNGFLTLSFYMAYKLQNTTYFMVYSPRYLRPVHVCSSDKNDFPKKFEYDLDKLVYLELFHFCPGFILCTWIGNSNLIQIKSEWNYLASKMIYLDKRTWTSLFLYSAIITYGSVKCHLRVLLFEQNYKILQSIYFIFRWCKL